MKLDKDQENAIAKSCERIFSIITGGAGTGKTTIIENITARLEANKEEVCLCAFAGKAAARIREACKHDATTIHRLLGYDGNDYKVETLDGKCVIIDEASMVDSHLLFQVVRRKPKRLILVGDPSQLPPVGRGQPFHDLLNVKPEIVCRLERCYRATEAVFKAATAIRHGARPLTFDKSDGEQWSMVNTGKPEATQKKILEWVKNDVFDFSKDVILVARNGETEEDPCTVKGLNAAIVELISPRVEGRRFNVGDRVMNLKNTPELDVWNGTTGEVIMIDKDGGVYVKTDVPALCTDGSGKTTDKVHFRKELAKNLQLAYVMTVHKSQGSQYRNVLMCCFNRDSYSLLDRSLFYTGVTRTKKACCVVGELGSAFAAIEKQNHKRTVIQQLAER